MEGLFALPVTLIEEELRPYTAVESGFTQTAEISARLLEYLEKTVTGEILTSSVTEAESGGLIVVTMRAACIENIAAVREYSTADPASP